MQLSVGTAKDADSYTAGKQAAEDAKTDDTQFVYVFASTSFELEKALCGVNDVFGEVPIAGCSSKIEITQNGIDENSIVVGAVSDVRDVGVGIGTGLEEDSYAAGESAITTALDQLDADGVSPFQNRRERNWRPQQNTLINIFADPLHGVGVDVLDGVNDVLGPGFSTTGEFAADNMQFEHTYVFYNGEVYEDAVVCCVMQTSDVVGSDRAHGFKPTPNEYTVTAAENTVVSELDEQPPAEIYAEVFGNDKARDPAFLLMAPFGLKDHDEEEYRLRVTLDVDEKGCYACGASVPTNETVTLMMGEKDSLLTAAGTAAERAVRRTGLDQDNITAAILFSCVARDAIYDDPEMTLQEVRNVQEHVGEDTPLIGVYGFGQIATSKGWAAFNEETMAVQVVGSESN